MLGLPVCDTHPAANFVAPALERGLLINAAGRNTLRFVPPLIITAGELREAMVRLRAAIASVLG
jgi:acetylornithine/succinyldiaminopimelate/putrescine aminotransferase